MRSALTRGTFLGMVAAGSISVAGLAVLAPVASSAAAVAEPQQPAAHEQRGHIEVTLTPWLAQAGTSRRQQFSVAYRPGMTPQDIAEAQGFHGSDLTSVMPVVNGSQVYLTTPLGAGDHVDLITGMAGG